MALDDDAARADLAFERTLLDSAAGDDPGPGATSEAWTRFALGAGAVATLGATGIGGAFAGKGSSTSLALKWLAIGAVSGGALTAAWFGGRADLVSSPGDGPATSPATPPSAAPSPAPLPAPTGTVESAGEALPPRGDEARRSADTRRVSRARLSVNPPPRSNLAAEVALIDGARTAISVGAFERALALVSQYRREFPEGALSREADVLAIQALAEKGEKAEVARNARSFLARHPRDPQAARVKELGEEVSFPVE